MEQTTKPRGHLCCYIYYKAPKRFKDCASPATRQGNHAKLLMAAETKTPRDGAAWGRKGSAGPRLSALGVM